MYTEELNKNSVIKKNNSSIIVFVVMFFVCITLSLLLFSNRDSSSSNVDFKLIGGDVYLNFNEEYYEQGFSLYDGNNNITSLVEVSNNIKYNVPGAYKVYYKYKDKLFTRNVMVLEPSNYELIINYEVNANNYTNQDILLKYNITGDAFSEVVLPNGDISKSSVGSVQISSNGTYIIKAYNLRREQFTKEIVIDNIDKEKPNGTCSVIVNTSSNIKVDATDNIGISKYEYYSNGSLITSSESNEYNLEGVSNNIYVNVYDNAGNYSEIKCDTEEKKVYDPIKPAVDETIEFQEETDTLKIYITNNRGYYLTRIWTKDAYNQLNKAVSPEYGNKLYHPKYLINNAVQNNNLQNKLVLGFNASGFYLRGSYDIDSVNKYSAYDKTEVGTIIINNGTLFRNVYDHAVKRWYITGINKENKFVIFEDNIATVPEEISSKQIWSQQVINSGIRNTFNFADPLIQNGQRVTIFSNSMPDPTNNTTKGLQLFCQVNENNYVLFTSNSNKRNVGIDKLMSLGCQTAFNFDGGGSVTLMYKSKNSNEFKVLLGNSREMPAIGYFSE